MIGNLVIIFLVSASFVYVVYYCFLFHFILNEYTKIFEMHRKGNEKGFGIDLPDYSEISFDISYSDYKKAKAYNEKMESLYEEINKL